MPVRFVVDPNLPAHVKTLTLAYTFFEAQDNGPARHCRGNVSWIIIQL